MEPRKKGGEQGAFDSEAGDLEFDGLEAFDSISATECTGLMSRAPENDYEYDSYFDVMTFSPKDFKSEENSERRPLSKEN